MRGCTGRGTSRPELEDYASFKAVLYAGIDRRFARYFAQAKESKPRIRLDEIAWGGVLQDGVPRLTGKHSA